MPGDLCLNVLSFVSVPKEDHQWTKSGVTLGLVLHWIKSEWVTLDEIRLKEKNLKWPFHQIWQTRCSQKGPQLNEIVTEMFIQFSVVMSLNIDLGSLFLFFSLIFRWLPKAQSTSKLFML